MYLFQFNSFTSFDGSRNQRACVIGSKDKGSTLKPRAPYVPKAKIGHSVRMSHGVLIFRKLYTLVGFNYPYWLGPKDTESRATLVPKSKLGHTEPHAPSVPKVKLGHTDRVRHWS